MKKSSKLVYIVVTALFVLLLAAITVIAVRNMRTKHPEEDFYEYSETVTVANDEPFVAEIEPAEAPDASELAAKNLEKAIVPDKITEKFALFSYDLQDGLLKLSYKSRAVANGERLYLTERSLHLDEYSSYIVEQHIKDAPVEKDGKEFYYVDRTLNYVSDSYTPNEALLKAVEDGSTEIQKGNSVERELIPVQRLYWFEDGVEYELESQYRHFSFDEMYELYKSITE